MIDTYLAQLSNENTRATYKRGLDKFATWALIEGIDLKDLRPQHVAAYVQHLKQELSGRSVNVYLSSLRAFLRWAGRFGYLPSERYTDALAVENVKVADTLPQTLTEDELDDVLCAPDLSTEAGLRDLAFISLLAATGMRLSEALDLDVEDLDFKRLTVVVFGKGSKERRVFFSQVAAENIRQYLGGRTTGPLFMNRFGERISGRYMQRRLHAYGLHPHALRHTFATELYKRTGDIRYVQEFLGHSRLDTTGVYVRAAGPREETYRSTMDTTRVSLTPRRDTRKELRWQPPLRDAQHTR